MDSSIIVVVIVSAVAFGLLVWLEIHSRRKKRSEAGQQSPGGPADTTGETAEGG
jgi:Flp pilus assembly protein CpaB